MTCSTCGKPAALWKWAVLLDADEIDYEWARVHEGGETFADRRCGQVAILPPDARPERGTFRAGR